MSVQSKVLLRLGLLLALSLALGARATSVSSLGEGDDVLKATLRNGMRVVIVRNSLSPVVSTDVTYLVGTRDDPPDVPGMAHAQEHMMFRGTKNLSTGELGTVATALGGSFNASTAETTTQFQFTVPASNLDAVLRIEADRMRDVLDAQGQWQQERGAIEQEVLSHEYEPGADFFRAVNSIAYSGTPYEHDGVGTKAAFDKLTGPRLKEFYEHWYAPNNALLVVAGDIDPASALARIRARFESIPRRAVAAHPVVHFAPLKRVVVQRTTTLVYPLAVVAFRFPGVNDPQFLASFVLQSILDSARGPLHELADTGEALEADWTSLPYTPDAQIGMATVALGPGADPVQMTGRIQDILNDYATHGVPEELFETTRRQLIASQEESRNSISELASDWATTIALDGEPSNEYEQQLLAHVTLLEVDAAAKHFLDLHHAIIGALTPSASASESRAPAPPEHGPENPLGAQSPVSRLPAWAAQLVTHIDVPPAMRTPTSVKLANGITLIVQPETISDSVLLYGSIKNNPALEEPYEQEGVSRILDAMFEYGTRTQTRVTFQHALDDLDAALTGGTGCGLEATTPSFERAVALLGQNELQPRLDEATFELARDRVAQELATSLGSSSTIATEQAAKKLYPPSDPELRRPTVAELQGLTLDDVKQYYALTFRPDLTTIVVVGNVTPDAARAAVEHAFGAWQATGAAPNTDLFPLPASQPGYVKVTIASNQDLVMLDQVIPLSSNDAASYGLLLGNVVLG
ncbi:MAG TPA: insulinase family protein, partial [Candidatus Baltobacteraceae bacterium]